MTRPIQAIIHTRALQHNIARLRRAAPGAQVMALVKASCYGHGLAQAFTGLQGTDGFSPLKISCAEQLRQLGWDGPILMIEGVFDRRDLEACSELDLWHVVHCPEQVEWLAEHRTNKPHHVFLALNSGMNRLGFLPPDYRAVHERLSGLEQVGKISLMTHFANADSDHGIDDQLRVFQQVTEGLPGSRSLCNSAATLRYGERPEIRGDWVRVGIAAYGASPDYPQHTIEDWDLKPAMSLRARLISATQIRTGDKVGYGSTFTADRDMRIGIVPCGYADGYPRHAGTGTPVLIEGVRSRTLGRVSMDMLAVDLTPVPGAGVGSSVTLWGQAPNGAVLPVEEIAQAAGTISNEVLSLRAQRVPLVVER